MMDGLFEVPEPATVPALTADQRRTRRQLETLTAGFHPLHGKLHAEAAPAEDRTAEGRRCGNCQLRGPGGHSAYPKCHFDPKRITNGPGTDCRAWWPACTHHVPIGECRREGATPTPDGWLIIDCEAHGEIGRIPQGPDEYGAAETLFEEHRTQVTNRP